MRERNNVAHTAFTIVALKEYMDTFGEVSESSNVIREAVRLASTYMTDLYQEPEEFCNYALALSVFSLMKEPSSQSSRTVTSMVTDLKSRIITSKDYPGACFVCNTCPSDTDSGSDSSEGYECSGRPTGEGSAACVETTAYTLLALMEAEETDSTICLAQWLVRIRSGNGGFYSSQDTVIAMQALSRFSEETYSSELNKTVTFDIQGLSADPVTITDETRFERTDYEVASVPSDLNCVNWSGEGTAIIQISPWSLVQHGYC